MKITEIVYIVNGAMGIKHHLKVIATNEGLERALQYIGGNAVKSREEKEVESAKEYLGSSADRFTTYFMDGAKRVDNTVHHSTGTVYSRTYS